LKPETGVDGERLSRDVRERYVKAFMDLVLLSLLVRRPMCGYELIAEVHERLRILPSPGAVYPLLSLLEGRGYVRQEPGNERRKKVYVLTPMGREVCVRLIEECRRVSELFLLSLQGAPGQTPLG